LIINKPITQASDVPTGNPNLTGATKCTVYVPTIYISYYVKTGTTWNGRPVEGYDDSFTDTAGNTYIVAISGTDCVIEHFLGAASITSLTVPNTMTIDGVTYTVVGIEYGAFESVSDYLTAITLPSGMNQFKSNCLSELGLLTSISVADGSQYYTADENGVLFSADGRILVKYPAGKPETSYVVGDTVILIGDHAFQNCTNLTEITIGAAVLVIDSTSFGGCALQTVTFMSETPPVLMGSDVFETTGDGFAVVIPAGKTDVYTAAINYNRYIPFMREQSEG